MSEQGSAQWRQERCGKVTASRIADMMARTQTGWGASRGNYLAELVTERLTGIPTEHFTSDAMKWGTETEPLARAAYEFYRDQEVQLVGFMQHPTIAMAGASPDGLVGTRGMAQFKCPNTRTHLETLLGAKIGGGYIKQCQFEMAVAKRDWNDWCSFDPRLPGHLQLRVIRVARDQDLIDEIETATKDFLAEIAATIQKLEEFR